MKFSCDKWRFIAESIGGYIQYSTAFVDVAFVMDLQLVDSKLDRIEVALSKYPPNIGPSSALI
jgi:hypothetical protein